MFHGIVAVPYTIDWVCGDFAKDSRIFKERIIASFEDFGENIKQSFSDHVPASIDCAVIVSNRNKVSMYDFQSQTDIFLCVPIRHIISGYVAMATRVHGKVWEVSIPFRDAHQKSLAEFVPGL
jgi:hypothetical protein